MCSQRFDFSNMYCPLGCGVKIKFDKDEKEFYCPKCGYVTDETWSELSPKQKELRIKDEKKEDKNA